MDETTARREENRRSRGRRRGGGAGGGIDLTGLIDKLERETDGDTVTVGDIVEDLGQRAFGPLFVVVALLAILPTGAIPGMSALTGALMTLVSVQLVCGARRIWLPARLERQEIGRERFVASLERVRRPARFVDRVLSPRLAWATAAPFSRALGVVAFLLSLLMYPLIVVPFGAFPSSVPILLFGLGLAARDGLVVLAGLAGSLLAAWGAIEMMPL